jgi:hypothetical protein
MSQSMSGQNCAKAADVCRMHIRMLPQTSEYPDQSCAE